MKIKVVIDNQSYTVEVEDLHSRPVIATVQCERFEVWPEAADTEGTARTGAPAVSVPESEPVSSALDAPADISGGRDVVSPLPGVIVAILVKPGERVTRGQELCTLEAMKMKNAIRANRDGAIASIEVNIGDQVSHGQALITFAE
jgi:glutaconyl-CoA/methylmalonyl-CoA decarboxylase subunit gamma